MNLIPYRMLASALLGLAVLAGAAGSGWYARSVVADRDMAKVIASHATALTAQAQEAQAAEAQQRVIQTRMTTALQEASDVAYKRSQARAVAVRTAAVSGDGLRIDAATFATRPDQAHTDTGIECNCPPDNRAVVLANVLADVELLGREMARVADEARDAGQACQAAYDALTPKPKE